MQLDGQSPHRSHLLKIHYIYNMYMSIYVYSTSMYIAHTLI